MYNHAYQSRYKDDAFVCFGVVTNDSKHVPAQAVHEELRVPFRRKHLMQCIELTLGINQAKAAMYVGRIGWRILS